MDKHQFEARLKDLASKTFGDRSFAVVTDYDPEREIVSARVVRRTSFWQQPAVNIRAADMPDRKIKESLNRLKRKCAEVV